MNHDIKTLAEAITNTKISNLVKTHVNGLNFDEENRHLKIFVDNAGPLHELEDKDGDHHLNNGLVKVYGDDITYELKMGGGDMSDREKGIGHNIHK